MIVLRWNLQNFSKSIKELDKMSNAITYRTRQKLKEAGYLFLKELYSITSKFKKSEGKWVRRNTKKLAESFESRNVSANMIKIISSAPYAIIQDVGGTIYSKSKRLLIPAVDYNDKKIHALREEGLTFVKGGVLFRKWGKGKRVIGWLKNSVYIPPKFYVNKTINKVTPRVVQLFKNAYKDL